MNSLECYDMLRSRNRTFQDDFKFRMLCYAVHFQSIHHNQLKKYQIFYTGTSSQALSTPKSTRKPPRHPDSPSPVASGTPSSDDDE